MKAGQQRLASVKGGAMERLTARERGKRKRRVRRMITWRVTVAMALLAAGLGMAVASGQVASALGLLHPKSATQLQLVTGRVMTIGSSVAEGWADKVGGGYLKRAIVGYSAYGGHPYTIISRAIAGDSAEKIDGKYHLWLTELRPQIVLMSWGGLDDASAKTPITDFRTTIHHQIELALQHHEVVFVVTPPITKASYTQYPTIEPMYLNNEMEVARAFHSPNVYVFDVFDQMKSYIAHHHQTYVPYMADG